MVINHASCVGKMLTPKRAKNKYKKGTKQAVSISTLSIQLPPFRERAKIGVRILRGEKAEFYSQPPPLWQGLVSQISLA